MRAQKAEEFIPGRLRDGAIADIGCGNDATFLSQTRFQKKFGLDRVDQHSPAGQQIKFANFDLEVNSSLPFDNHSLEVMTMLAVYEHLKPEALNAVLKDVYRTLKPGGVFILTMPSVWAEPILNVMAFFELVDSQKIDEHKKICTTGDIVKSLEGAGFHKEKIKFGYFECRLNRWFCVER